MGEKGEVYMCVCVRGRVRERDRKRPCFPAENASQPLSPSALPTVRFYKLMTARRAPKNWHCSASWNPKQEAWRKLSDLPESTKKLRYAPWAGSLARRARESI